MINVSDTWKNLHQGLLLPESFIEIDCAVTEQGAQESATATGENEAIFSNIENMISFSNVNTAPKYATLETNIWALNGSLNILPDAEPYNNAGYVSDVETTGSVTLTLPEVHTVPIPGVTIIWSGEFGEYPETFTVTAKNGNTVVTETTITNNREQKNYVDLELSGYDSVTVTIHDWCLPNRRPRIDRLYLGHILTFTKTDIISYEHEQYGDLLSGELPKNFITFTLDNTNDFWNPNNPAGIERYLIERQRVNVRYGLDVNGTVEWIKAGTFYLSEWYAPANGIEAHFVARDLFEFLIYEDNPAYYYSPLAYLVEFATNTLLPPGASVVVDESLENYSAEYIGDGTSAEMVQKVANAAKCILRYDRDGVLYIEPFENSFSDYTIPLSLSYSHPEITLSKPLKSILVSHGEDKTYELAVSTSGEKQTVENSFINTEERAMEVAEWVRDTLETRRMVSGEFRADPRLDLFDVIAVESKYGTIAPVVITDIKYTFNGSFRGSYKGRVLKGTQAELDKFVLDRDALS